MTNLQKKVRVSPTINNLENNSFMHYQHHIFSVEVATTVYLLMEVTDPPPDLFLRNPVCAFAIQHTTQFVNHAMCMRGTQS